MVLPPVTELLALGLYNYAIHTFVEFLKEVVVALVGALLPSPSPEAPTGKVVTRYLLHFCFLCGVAVDGYLPPIWEAVVRGRGRVEGLATMNQALMHDLPSYRRVFGGRTHFSASLPLIAFETNVILLNPYLDPVCTRKGRGGGSCSV